MTAYSLSDLDLPFKKFLLMFIGEEIVILLTSILCTVYLGKINSTLHVGIFGQHSERIFFLLRFGPFPTNRMTRPSQVNVERKRECNIDVSMCRQPNHKSTLKADREAQVENCNDEFMSEDK